jgi:GH15 family glucan-1,4-alpha-glucosidase
MPRDLPLGNGSLLISFDKSYNLRDIYWPHVGQELHTGGDISHTGVWVDGQFAWLDAPEWQRELIYERETLVTHVTLSHSKLQLHLVFNDVVDFNRPLFLRHVMVTNSANRQRQVRLFFHYQAEGNPWFICSLWLAQYRIAHGTTLDELHSALPLLEPCRIRVDGALVSRKVSQTTESVGS